MATRKIKTTRPHRGAAKAAPITYQDSGVNMEAGENITENVRDLLSRTWTPRVLGPFGGFAGLFSLDFHETLLRRNYREPVLVSCCNGVGSKLKVAVAANKLDTVGIDLVALSANDLICCGAEPLFFLDYLAVGQLDRQRVRQIFTGLSSGCVEAGCALMGGETAEMPDFFRREEFDMAGFAVGVVERKNFIDGSEVRPGDAVIAIASSGLHSNGFGLARKAILERAGLDLADRPAELEGRTVAEAMLTPTAIYVKAVLDVLGAYKVRRVVKAMAHITAGGLGRNLPRALPEGLTIRLKRSTWNIPGIFRLIARSGPVDEAEMFRVFNMGIGFVMVVAPGLAEGILSRLSTHGLRSWLAGKVVEGIDLQWA
jgi:phosphoribosylformylglycinamidine cyclo-ligase